MGDTARTRLAEAQRLLDQANAELSSNPSAAVADAQRAGSLAQEAYRLAGDDFSDWNQGGPGWGQRGGGGQSPGAVLAGDIIGGIIGGILASGGRGRGFGSGVGWGGGWGGSNWGGHGGGHGGGGWGGGGGFGTGGFGGGGRARGGHW
jgi:hypothetical protein